MTRVIVICSAVFLLSNGCETGPTAQGYELDLDGIDSNVTVGGTLNLSTQLKKNGTNHAVTADTLEVSAQVVCGNNKSEVIKAKVDAQGKATFAPLTLDNSWSGACKITLSATIDSQEISTTKNFTIGSSRGGADKGNDTGGDNDLGNFISGVEYSLDELEQESNKKFDGYLFLQNCMNAILVALDDDNLQATDDKGKIAASSDTDDWKYVIGGEVSSNCKLMYTTQDIDDGQAVANIVATPADSPAKDKIKAVSKSEHDDKTIITTGEVNDGELYVSNDGSSWNKVSSPKWNGITTTQTKWGAVGKDNRALLRIVSTNKTWWSLKTGDISAGMVKSSSRGGKLFSINGLGSNKKAKIKLTNNLCGVRVFQFSISGDKMNLQTITTTEKEMTADDNGTIGNFFAVDTPQQGCQLSFTIDAQEVAAASTTTASGLPNITMEKQYEGLIKFSAMGNGNVSSTYVFNNGTSGEKSSFKWLNGEMTTFVNWNNNDASKNLVIIVLHTQGYMYAAYQQGS